MRWCWGGLLVAVWASGWVPGRADGPGDNVPEKVRPIPPVGMKLSPEEREKLTGQLGRLGKAVAELPGKLKGKPALLDLVPDVEVFHAAVRRVLQDNGFYKPAEVAQAHKQLALGLERARQLAAGEPDWVAATGLVVRGYRSRIDGSVQPYGLVVPASYRADGATRHRLDVWLHGRGETATEVNFISGRLSSPGLFVPANAFVLHPFGRYCNAFKFAGEVDVIEALEHVQKRYPIDEDRVVMRGFSMGGAGCWQLAAHYPGKWVAAAPGAGFSETPEFLRVFQKEKLAPEPWVKTLWRLHDCPGWAGNFVNLPVVAYSGEKDSQKQAADVMAPAFEAENVEMVHLIGPGTGHSYHPRSKSEIDRRIGRIVARGRDRVPPRVKFTTYTLRYDRSYWVRIEGMRKHWEKATVDATLTGGEKGIRVHTENVTDFTLSFGPGDCPLEFAANPVVTIDGKPLKAGPVRSDRSWSASFAFTDGAWSLGRAAGKELRKRHGLQGPIDDAFMDSFLMVRPTGKAWHERTGAWVKGEMAHAVEHWRKHFRGDARVKDDSDLTEEDVRDHNLVLWGDPSSNAVLARIADRLPLKWTEKELSFGKRSFGSGHHVAVMVYPNPLNPSKYVVLNSGFTFREYDYLNNARQVPRLPDHAVIDVRMPPTSQWPGKVVTAGFFNERWK